MWVPEQTLIFLVSRKKSSGMGRRHKEKPKQRENLKKKSEISQPVASRLSNEKKEVWSAFLLSINPQQRFFSGCEPERKNTRKGRLS